jgi:hypothetical protein
MKQTTLLAAVLLVAPSLFAADPQLLSMAPPDANTFAGVNVEQVKTSPFGQFLLNHVPQHVEFEKFMTLTGFDPRRDLREVLIAGSIPARSADAPKDGDASFAGTNWLMLAKGNFNIPQILSAAPGDKHVQISTYAGVQVLTIEGSLAFGLIDGSTVVAGEVAHVKAALDRRSGPGSVINPTTMARINQLSTTQDAWSVSSTGFIGGLPGFGSGASGSAVLQSIQQASAGIKFGSTIAVTVQAVAATAQDATSLSDVAKMLSQMVAMHGGPDGPPAQLTDLLKSLTITTDGNTVNLSLSLPESDVEALVNMANPKTAHATI